MDFGLMPPEMISALMYAGPGPESMVAAATAWQQLATDLRAAAAAYESTVTGLTAEAWRGPSSVAMASAVRPYIGWMNATAVLAERTAAQAAAATSAFETAFAAVVPPPAIAANRSQLAVLQATNVIGQNAAAIAATEAEYAAMRAQNTATMYAYAAESAVAATLPAFTPPNPTANPAGQLAAMATTTAQPFAANPQSLLAVVPAALQAPAALANPAQGLLSTLQDLAGMQTLSSLAAHLELIPKLILPFNDAAIGVIMGLALGTRGVAQATPAGKVGPTTPIVVSATERAGRAVAADLGGARAVGGLAVPPSWATATPAIRLAASALQDSAEAAAPVGSAGLLGQVAAAGMAGSALGGVAHQAIGGTVARVGRLTGDKRETPEKLRKVLAELSCKPESVQHWHTDQAQLEGLLARLAKKPGIHAVHLSAGPKTPVVPPEAQTGP